MNENGAYLFSLLRGYRLEHPFKKAVGTKMNSYRNTAFDLFQNTMISTHMNSNILAVIKYNMNLVKVRLECLVEILIGGEPSGFR